MSNLSAISWQQQATFEWDDDVGNKLRMKGKCILTSWPWNKINWSHPYG